MDRTARGKSLSPVTGARWAPGSGIFAPTTGLDPVLFDGDRLRPAVREAVMDRLGDVLLKAHLPAWRRWLRAYIAGGSASEWAGSRPNEGAQDLDVLMGADYESARSHVPALSGMSDGQVDAALNAILRGNFNEQGWEPPFGGRWDVTGYVNHSIGTSGIGSIRPYAAWDLSRDEWAVRPPHLPGHSLADFDPAVLAHARAVTAQARAILKMPEPLRSREAADLWEHVHQHRCTAFSSEGEGWQDPGNVDEKWLSYAPGGLLAKIRELALPARTATTAIRQPAPEEFAHEVYNGDTSDLRLHGDKYILHRAGPRHINAYARGRELVAPDSPNYTQGRAQPRPVGYLSWTSGQDGNPPEIYKTMVKEKHRRKGVATAMLGFAREIEPGLQHSISLSEDAKEWVKGMDQKTAADSGTVYREAREYACPDGHTDPRRGHLARMVVPEGSGIEPRCTRCRQPMAPASGILHGSWESVPCCTPGPGGKWAGPPRDPEKCTSCYGTRQRNMCTSCKAGGCTGDHDYCLECDGTGHETCPGCGGDRVRPGEEEGSEVPCTTCGESGEVSCSECHGSGAAAVGPKMAAGSSTAGRREDQLAAMDGNTRASALAQEHVRGWHPRLTLPLYEKSGQGNHAMRKWLSDAGVPMAGESYVSMHRYPDERESCTGRGPDGEPCVVLHPDRWDYGTMAHETAHLITDHEAGRRFREPHGPEGAHGAQWAGNYARLLNGISREAGDDFLAKRDEHLGATTEPESLEPRAGAASHLGETLYHSGGRDFPGDEEWVHVGTHDAALNRARDWNEERERRGEPATPAYLHAVRLTGSHYPTERSDNEANDPVWRDIALRGGHTVIPYENEYEDPGTTSYLAHRSAVELVHTEPLMAREAASGYDLTPRTGMIYLDLPEDAVRHLPGGVDDHHITVVYLGKGLSDEQFEEAKRRAAMAAAQAGPLSGFIRGVGTFPPSGSSGEKVPAFVPAYVPGIGKLRELLEDLSASEHRQFRPHVTLAYLEPGEELPEPHPTVPVRFTRLHVKRGDDIVSFPLGTTRPSARTAATGGRQVSVHNGKYAISYPPGNYSMVEAHHLGSDGQPEGRWIGYMTHDDGGGIGSIHVREGYRREGIATALLSHARAQNPDLTFEHSGNLTADGKKWLTGIGERDGAREPGFYHGSYHDLEPGQMVTPAGANDAGRRYMQTSEKHVFYTDDLGLARSYGPKVYRVEPVAPPSGRGRDRKRMHDPEPGFPREYEYLSSQGFRVRERMDDDEARQAWDDRTARRWQSRGGQETMQRILDRGDELPESAKPHYRPRRQ